MHIQCSLDETVKELLKYEQWFFDNRLFLPRKFPDYWLAGRNKLRQLQILEKVPDSDSKKLSDLAKEIDDLFDGAISEIYKEMNLEKIEISTIEKKKNLPPSEQSS